jgi:hypothetical protein
MPGDQSTRLKLLPELIHGFVDAGDEPAQRGGCAGSAFFGARSEAMIYEDSAPF